MNRALDRLTRMKKRLTSPSLLSTEVSAPHIRSDNLTLISLDPARTLNSIETNRRHTNLDREVGKYAVLGGAPA